nr:glycosyltransferase family 4 protein [Clostridium butyricum]
MNYRISCIVPEKCILYQGPYKDIRKFVQYIYDIFFLKNFKTNVETSLTKSNLAKFYLEEKGFKNVHTIGVGLDIENIEQTCKYNHDEDSYLKKIHKKINGRKVLLYIGVLEERRNIKFLFDIVKNILESNLDVVLLMVGNGKKTKVNEYFNYMRSIGIEENVIWIEKISQGQIKKLYALSNVFVLPTKYEIFGMVILESMYFGIPVVTSLNGGSSMLIENEENGYILEDFIVEEWSNRILFLLNNENIQKKIGKRSNIDICGKFKWGNIVDNIIKNIK